MAGLMWWLFAASVWCCAGTANPDRYETLVAGDKEYSDVIVRSKNASSLIVMHSGGLAQIPLKDLPEALQRRYGYNEREDRSRSEGLDRIRQEQIIASKLRLETRRKEEQLARAQRSGRGAGQAVQMFGVPPALDVEKDLRPSFKQLGIHIRDQRKHPSCAIHAIVGALEYLEGRRYGSAENLSESYLYWATLKTLGRYDQSQYWGGAGSEAADAGFQLREVFQALRAFGIPNAREAEEFGFAGFTPELDVPTNDLIQQARFRSQFRAFAIPGRDRNILLGNIVHALNAGEPVVIGLAWPHFRALRKTAYLDKQKPKENYGHAVTLVGYKCPSGKLEDITFIFRNSWGARWGASGYGYIRYGYMSQNIFSAYVMEAHGA